MTSYVPEAARHRIIEAFGNRCSYCLAAQQYVLSKLEIEHIIPVALDGSNDEWNLCLACRLCNLYKSDQIEATDPIKSMFSANSKSSTLFLSRWTAATMNGISVWRAGCATSTKATRLKPLIRSRVCSQQTRNRAHYSCRAGRQQR